MSLLPYKRGGFYSIITNTYYARQTACKTCYISPNDALCPSDKRFNSISDPYFMLRRQIDLISPIKATYLIRYYSASILNMIKKTAPNHTHLERIPESLSGQSETKPPSSSHFAGKRVSIATLMNSLKRPEKATREEARQEDVQASKVEEKDRMIKELQQQILEKKLKNDMIQDAFHRRNEAETGTINYAHTLSIVFSACKLLAAQNRSFKRAYLRSVLNILRQSGKSRQKAVKSLLIWTISWITRLFTFLSSTLIKK